MDDQLHLHDGERLLALFHASRATFIGGLFRAIVDAAIAAFILSIIAVAVGWFGFGVVPASFVYLLLFLLSYAGAAFMRWRFWKESALCVTTERILMHHRRSILSEPMHTIKWSQFQEGFVQRRKPWELISGLRGICIRYGTADAQHMTCFPGIHYAMDLKHYLDKVDSAVRQGKINDVKYFVDMPKGLRDKF